MRLHRASKKSHTPRGGFYIFVITFCNWDSYAKLTTLRFLSFLYKYIFPKYLCETCDLKEQELSSELAELGRVVKAEHRIEDCIKRAKSEAGLSDYEVRTWTGWYHHQTLSLIAAWFLIRETQRGGKTYPRNHGSTDTHHVGHSVASGLRSPTSWLADAFCTAKKQASRNGSSLSLQAT